MFVKERGASVQVKRLNIVTDRFQPANHRSNIGTTIK
jgi:hypothetical protein